MARRSWTMSTEPQYSVSRGKLLAGASCSHSEGSSCAGATLSERRSARCGIEDGRLASRSGGIASAPVVVDLCLGAWRAREAAFQLCLQCGLTLDSIDGAGVSNGTWNSRGVNVEARGDALISAAYRDGRNLAAALAGGEVRVLPPKFGAAWRPENEWIFHYLSLAGVALICEGDPPPFRHAPDVPWFVEGPIAIGTGGPNAAEVTPDQRRLLRFFPGLLPEVLVVALGFSAGVLPGLPTVAPGFRFIPPRWRDQAPGTASAEINGLARRAVFDDGLYAFVQVFGSNLFIDATALARLGFRQFLAGSSHLALDLLARARSGAREPKAAALCDLHTQGIRIFEHRFEEVAAMAAPSPKLPLALQLELRRMKGWGEIMLGRVDSAIDNLRACLDALDQGRPLTEEDIYLINIYALSRYRAGDIAGALALEDQIERCLLAKATPDFRLVFVNAINQARLHRALGNRENYASCLERAFATSDGARSWSEIVQLNVMRADSLAQTDWAEVRGYLLRAALAWLALPAPESSNTYWSSKLAIKITILLKAMDENTLIIYLNGDNGTMLRAARWARRTKWRSLTASPCPSRSR